MKQRYVELGWKILEAKYRYYVLDKPRLQDFEYDMMEKEYDKLADELGLPKSASDMIGFDETRPSCIEVIAKIKKG